MTTRPSPAAWNTLELAMKKETALECRVTHAVPGGLQVQVCDLIAFFPQSQLELGESFELDSYLGKTLRCHVLKMQIQRLNIVVGRNKLLQEAKKKRQDKALQRIQPDTIVQGIVKKMVPYGAFVELDGIDGLIRNHDMSWGKCRHPREYVQLGQHVSAKVVSINCVDQKIELSLRAALPDPWSALENWTAGTHLQGTIVSMVDYGCFVRLIDGVEGLLHISNMPVPKPIFALNSLVNVVISNIDLEKKRISLSLAP